MQQGIPLNTRPEDIAELRRRLRRLRRALDPEELRRASRAVNARIMNLPSFRRARRIAAYVGTRSEIDPMPLLHRAHLMGKRCYLPVLHPVLPGRLWFVPWRPDTPMRPNRFEIPEPIFTVRERCKPQWLDLIVMPLLGFDDRCHRLGMGGGFYDRTLAFARYRRRWERPCMIGVAHEVQRCERIPAAPWDIRPSMIVTPSGIHECATHHQ